VDGALEMRLVPLVRLADVDQLGAGIDLLARLRVCDQIDPLLDLIDRLSRSGHQYS
jgi:hypothetical protein